MELKRKPFQGVLNIICFNWHFYIIAGIILILILHFKNTLPEQIRFLAFCASALSIKIIIFSLLISFYIYDFSDLYKLAWLPSFENKTVLNVNAGFDETSEIIKSKFPSAELIIGDFYDPTKHTEISIKRARKAYPPVFNTIHVSTDYLPFQDNSFDYTLAIFSVHEIRKKHERIKFFKELNRVTKPEGTIFVTEHLRDWNNFMAYNIGFFHFYSKADWLEVFKQANLMVKEELKITPFITTFILYRDGNTL